jgi:diadenosine tetraphosphate (Ap4A) HIT family hydrolase
MGRVQVWEDELWRLTMSIEAEVLGFSYLEPKRHIPHVTDLGGEEARTFGQVLARVSAVLKSETGPSWFTSMCSVGESRTCTSIWLPIMRAMLSIHR